jgi:hypothetical protein
VHRWDPWTDHEETLGALSDLVAQGKVRYIGSSTYPAPQVCATPRAAARRRRDHGDLHTVVDVSLFVLTGAPGSGKTLQLEALSNLLAGDGVSHGCLEAEQLARGEPWLSQVQ